MRRGVRVALRMLIAASVVLLVLAAAAAGPVPVPDRWLGLNDNSGSGIGHVSDFASAGVVYDHDIETVAGETLSTDGCSNWMPGSPASHVKSDLDTSLAAGMTPVVTIEYCGASNDYGRCPSPTSGENGSFISSCLPTTAAAIRGYADGVVTTAQAIRRYAADQYPGSHVLFELVNEPWGFTTGGPGDHGTFNATQYARLVSMTLTATDLAGIPATDVYAGAINRHDWVPGMYAGTPSLRTQIRGWYLHTYGLPGDPRNGIAAARALHDANTPSSGWGNVIVSELGFCVSANAGRPLPAGDVCGLNRRQIDITSGSEAATLLTASLHAADLMHEAGWLKAVMVWSRTYSQPARLGYHGDAQDGWAMQLPDGSLTPMGQALLGAAEAMTGPEP